MSGRRDTGRGGVTNDGPSRHKALIEVNSRLVVDHGDFGSFVPQG